MEANAESASHLSYAVITWKINNISLAMCPHEAILNCPGFTISGPVRTGWLLYIDIQQQKNKMTLYLEMVDIFSKMFTSSEKNEFKVTFSAYILDANGEHAWGAERELRVKLRDRLAVEDFELSEVYNTLSQQGPDWLTIRCHLLVDFGIKFNVLSDVPNGIKSLSMDMLRILNKSFYSDIIFIRGENRFHLHKDMLLNRGSGLAALIMTHCNNDVIRLLNYEDKSLLHVILYLYSGDLRCIYDEPRIMIYDIVERFKIPELKYSYPKENIKLEYTVEANEYIFKWNIKNFDDLEDSLSGPELYRDGMESRWQIHVHPKGPVNANHQQKNFVFVEALLLESSRTLDVCIEFTCVNEQHSILYGRRTQRRMKSGDSRTLQFFLMGGTLMKRCLVNKTLLLRFTVRIAIGRIHSGISSICPPHPCSFDNAQSLLHFSKSMKSVLQSPLNSDITVCNASVGIKAHRFLLGARSSVFYGKLNPKEDIVSIPSIETRILKIFLEYLYTGLLVETDEQAVIYLYEMSAAFRVPDLLSLCSNFLTLTPDNVLYILEISDDRKLVKLKSEALQMVSLVGPGILKHKTWRSFKNRKPELANDVMEFLNRSF